MLWLKWFAAFLEAAGGFAPISKQAHGIGHTWLNQIERIIVSIVLLRAAPRVRRVNPRQRISQHRRNDTALRRAIIGSALRRALRAKDLRQRIEALTQSIGTLVARLLKRLPRGLACRRPIIAAPESPNVDGLCVFLTATLFADTS